MRKVIEVQGMSNGLVLHIQKEDGSPEGTIVMDDGSEAYKQFRSAFEACADKPAEEVHADPEPSHEEHERAQAGGGHNVFDDSGHMSGDGLFDLFMGVAGWVNEKERVRHQAKAQGFKK